MVAPAQPPLASSFTHSISVTPPRVDTYTHLLPWMWPILSLSLSSSLWMRARVRVRVGLVPG